MVQIGKLFANFALFAKNDGLFGYLGGVHGFFNCWYVSEWCGFCVIHNLKNKNTIVSKITMRVNSKSACILLLVLEAFCT